MAARSYQWSSWVKSFLFSQLKIRNYSFATGTQHWELLLALLIVAPQDMWNCYCSCSAEHWKVLEKWVGVIFGIYGRKQSPRHKQQTHFRMFLRGTLKVVCINFEKCISYLLLNSKLISNTNDWKIIIEYPAIFQVKNSTTQSNHSIWSFYEGTSGTSGIYWLAKAREDLFRIWITHVVISRKHQFTTMWVSLSLSFFLTWVSS